MKSTTKSKPKLRINATAVREIKNALQHLDALVAKERSEAGSRCGVSEHEREAVRSYLRSWVISRLNSALDRIEGRRESRTEGRNNRTRRPVESS